MDEMTRFLAVQAIEADLLHRRERLERERQADRRASYERRAARAAARRGGGGAAGGRRGIRSLLRQWSVSGSGAWRVAP